MTIEEIRLECIKVAADVACSVNELEGHEMTEEEVFALAKRFVAFVRGTAEDQ